VRELEPPEAITEEELTALALAADPDADLGDDAVSLWDVAPAASEDLLPEWYMPAAMAGVRLVHGWRRTVVLVIIVSFLLINAYGLCSTYGWVSIA